jgi:hypothetical protein
MGMEHQERQQWVAELSRINQTLNDSSSRLA